MLEGKLEVYLDENERRLGKCKKGKGSKLVKTSSGNMEINTPRNRLCSF